MQRDRRTGLELIPQDLLRKYIIYARENIHPKLDERVASRFTKLYSELRKESLATGSVVVTVRMVESMIRLAEAHAKVFLRQHVNDEDVDMAIRIMLDSFISTQKASILRQMERKFSKYRLNNRSSTELLLFVLRQMAREQLLYESTRIMSDSGDTIKNISIPESEFLEKARVLRIDNVQPFYDSEAFSGDHFTYDRKRRVIEQAIF